MYFLLFHGLCKIQNGCKSQYLQVTCESWTQNTKTASAAAQEPLINKALKIFLLATRMAELNRTSITKIDTHNNPAWKIPDHMFDASSIEHDLLVRRGCYWTLKRHMQKQQGVQIHKMKHAWSSNKGQQNEAKKGHCVKKKELNM